MAETLRWPSSLKKQVNHIQKLEAKANTVSLKLFIMGLLVGVVIFIITKQYIGNATIRFLLSISWILIVIIITYGRRMFSINFESDKIKRGLTGELIVAHELDKLPDEWLIINDIVLMLPHNNQKQLV